MICSEICSCGLLILSADISLTPKDLVVSLHMNTNHVRTIVQAIKKMFHITVCCCNGADIDAENALIYQS